jgi:hypothetical protein
MISLNPILTFQPLVVAIKPLNILMPNLAIDNTITSVLETQILEIPAQKWVAAPFWGTCAPNLLHNR